MTFVQRSSIPERTRYITLNVHTTLLYGSGLSVRFVFPRMPNKNYNRGRALEYRVMKHFRSKGFEVFRSAGSHSKVDVIAIASDKYLPLHKILLVQCKTGKGLMTKKEKKEFQDYGQTLGCHSLLAYRVGRKLVIE